VEDCVKGDRLINWEEKISRQSNIKLLVQLLLLVFTKVYGKNYEEISERKFSKTCSFPREKAHVMLWSRKV
jgi:hypothetical protein